jgi:hypothetical protein
LDEDRQREFERLLGAEPYKGVQAMNVTWYEKGVAKGIEKGIKEAVEMNVAWYEKGIEKERRESLRELLEERFGPLAPSVLSRLEELPLERLQPLRKALLKAQSLAELGLAD